VANLSKQLSRDLTRQFGCGFGEETFANARILPRVLEAKILQTLSGESTNPIARRYLIVVAKRH
jgi:hypothetical protein